MCALSHHWIPASYVYSSVSNDHIWTKNSWLARIFYPNRIWSLTKQILKLRRSWVNLVRLLYTETMQCLADLTFFPKIIWNAKVCDFNYKKFQFTASNILHTKFNFLIKPRRISSTHLSTESFAKATVAAMGKGQSGAAAYHCRHPILTGNIPTKCREPVTYFATKEMWFGAFAIHRISPVFMFSSACWCPGREGRIPQFVNNPPLR